MAQNRPGISRAIPGALAGLAAGAIAVYVLRAVSGIEPYWDASVALVLTPFTMMAGWMWGIGAFNPKLSEHAEHAEEAVETAIVAAQGEEAAHAHEHEEEEEKPLGILLSQIWKIFTYPLLAFLIFYAIAALPTGLLVQITDREEASTAAFSNEVVLELPLFGTVETTQLVLFLGFAAFTIVSLLVFAGIIGFLFYAGHQQVATVAEMEVTPRQTTPPAPVRWIGRGSQSAARGLRRGLPRFFGKK